MSEELVTQLEDHACSGKKLEHSFIMSLCAEQYFIQWARLSLNYSLHLWVHLLVIAGRTESGSNALNNFCR